MSQRKPHTKARSYASAKRRPRRRKASGHAWKPRSREGRGYDAPEPDGTHERARGRLY